MPRPSPSRPPAPAAKAGQALAQFLHDELGIGQEEEPAAWQHSGPLWRWQAKARDGTQSGTAWHFLTIDGACAAAIRLRLGAQVGSGRRGFGSIKVRATIGSTSWSTSIFPSAEAGGFLLPVKAAVRRAAQVADGDVVSVTLVADRAARG